MAAGRDRHSHSTLHGPLGAVCHRPPPISHALFYLCSSTWLLQLLSLQGIFCTFCHLCEISIFQASWP